MELIILQTSHKATSAGTEKGRVTNHKLKDFQEHSNLFICMKEIGLDITENSAKALTKKMVKEADKIIIMAEKDTWPDFLKESNKIIFWQIEDIAGQSLNRFRDIRNQIKECIEKLIQEVE